MANDRNNDFTLTNYLKLTSQRDTTLDQVPFFLGVRGLLLRKFLEVILAENWTVTDVSDEGTHNITADDVVIISGHSTNINLPSVDQRFLVVKDGSGACGETGQAITINRAGSDTIDGTNTSFKLQSNYGAVLLIGGNGTQWHVIGTV
tara:strand:+ start:638 stop:1081 length:444 start_codon:yes stop_codon:yes gene_type:complete